ncbi:MAG: hypothetical protein IKI10_07525 [Muribaculaceae bacterium]|nr:hypothetical protein [Muribaculaceae bacterium]
MKKIMIIMVLVLVSLSSAASDDSNGSLNERLYKAKVRELVYRLHITADQQKKFEPIYRSYCEEMSALWASRKRPIKPSTSGDAAAIAKRKMEMQQQAQGIRMKYIDRLATVLNADQVDRFFEVESRIQKKLKEKHDQARSQRTH